MTDPASPSDRPAARGLRRRDLIVGGTLAAVSVAAYARTPRRKQMAIGPHEIEKVIPLTIGPWHFQTASGLIVPTSDQLVDSLYDQQLTRTYEADPASLLPPVMLLIAYGSSQSGMLQVHRPEVCYPAGGFRLTPLVPVEVKAGGHDIPSQYFTASRDLRTERVLYWTRIGTSIPRSWAQQRMAVVEANLRGTIPDGVLVRLSTIGGDAASSEKALLRFADLMVAETGPAGRRLLVGDGLGEGKLG